MKKYFFLFSTIFMINFNVGAAEAPAKHKSQLAVLPEDLQKEVLSKITDLSLIKKLESTSKHLKSLILQMKQKRELAPEILWRYEDLIRSRRLEGHTELVNGLALSDDKKMVLTGSGDRTAKIWDAHTGALMRTLECNSRVRAVALSHDKKIAMTGLENGTAQLWNVDTGDIIKTFDGHTDEVFAVALSTDRQLAMTGSDDQTAKIWNVETGKLIHTLSGHMIGVNSVSISADKKVATTLSGTVVRLWNPETGELIITLPLVQAKWLIAPQLSGDKKIMITGSLDGTVKIWDVVTGKTIRTLVGHTRDVVTVVLSPDKQLAVTGSFDKTVKIWNVNSGELIQTLSTNSADSPDDWNYWVTVVALSPDKLMVVAALWGGTAIVWDIEKGT